MPRVIGAIDAGITVAHSKTDFRERVLFNGSVFYVEEGRYDPAAFEEMILVGGGAR